jgi:hypothetical protein
MSSQNLVVRSTATTDPTISGGRITLPGVFDANLNATKTVTLEYNAIKSVRFAEGAAATQGVVTPVVSGSITAGNIFSFQLVQDISALTGSLGDEYSQVFTYTLRTGDTATSVAQAIVAWVNSLPFEATATNSGGTVTITATAQCPVIIGAELVDQGGNLAVTNTTGGVRAIGQGADMLAAGIAEAVTGQSYDVYTITYKTFKQHGSVDNVSERLDTIVLYVDETAGSTSGAYSSALGGTTGIFNGTSASTVAELGARYLDVMN